MILEFRRIRWNGGRRKRIKIEWKQWSERLKSCRYPLLILLVGVLLLLTPGKHKADAEPETKPELSAQSEQQRLEDILEQIDGVGAASVLLSYRTSAETEYLSDDDGTVILSAGSGTQTAVVLRTIQPAYQGAVVVCSGGGDASVKLQVVEAVSKFTGLGAGAISVFPLKTGK